MKMKTSQNDFIFVLITAIINSLAGKGLITTIEKEKIKQKLCLK